MISRPSKIQLDDHQKAFKAYEVTDAVEHDPKDTPSPPPQWILEESVARKGLGKRQDPSDVYLAKHSYTIKNKEKELRYLAMADPHLRKVFLSLTTLEEKIGQLIVLKVEGSWEKEAYESTRQAILDNQIGGLLLQGGSLERWCYLANIYQNLSKHPLFFIADGTSSLSLPLDEAPRFPRLIDMAYLPEEDVAHAWGKTLGQQSKMVGLHVFLTPSLSPLEKLFQHETPSSVASFQNAFLDGLAASGMLAARKLTPLQKKIETPQKKKIRKPQAALGLQALIANVAHSQSVKQELSFCDLERLEQQQATNTYEAALEALLAGCDMILTSQDPAQLIDFLVQAIRQGRWSEAQLDQKVLSVLTTKEACQVFYHRPVSLHLSPQSLREEDALQIRQALMQIALKPALKRFFPGKYGGQVPYQKRQKIMV